MNLAHVLVATAERSPDATALVFRDRRITFRELDQEAAGIAAALHGLGVEAGDRVALWVPNHPAFASAMYGAWRCGAIVVPVHSMLTRPETRHILTDSGARVLVCGAEQYAQAGRDLRAELDGLERIVVLDGPAADDDLTFGDAAATAPLSTPVPELASDHLALIAYTSGTSGLPKGAMLTHENLRANLEQMRQIPVGIGPDDVTLCVLPLFHIFGLNVVLNLSVHVGARLVLLERFDPAESLEAIGREGVTVIAAAPPAYVAWLSLADAATEAFRGVRVAVSGAAPLPREVLVGFAERFGVTIWEGYGLTETAPALTSTSVGGEPKPGSIGRPLPGVELRLVNEEGDDVELGDPGEVVVRGPNVFRGYWQHPDDTSRAFSKGWFRTGDVAVADDDADLYLVDRKRDLILVSGFNVYPKEVEDVLRNHPKITDCAVIGAPDPYHGEQVRAIVVADGLGEQDVIAHCAAALAPYKVPAAVEFTDQIPRNAAGKVLRRVLRD